MIVIQIVGFYVVETRALERYFYGLVRTLGTEKEGHEVLIDSDSRAVTNLIAKRVGYLHIIGPKGEALSKLVRAVRSGEYSAIRMQVIDELQY